MNRSRVSLVSFCCLAVLILSACRASLPPNSLATHNSARWEKDIAAFEASDRTNPPPQRPIVFVGSSSIRMWRTLAQDFPGKPVINRGFGGSQLADAVYFADRIIIKYKPRQVIIYSGTNDINAGKDPDLVYGDFVALVRAIRAQVPDAKIGYISIAPNMARWSQIEKIRRANALIREYSEKHGIDYIDAHPVMLGANGMPKDGIYIADRLHMNAEGYKLWKTLVAPYLL